MKLLNSTSKTVTNHLVEFNGKQYHRVAISKGESFLIKWFSPTDIPIGKHTDRFKELESNFEKMILN